MRFTKECPICGSNEISGPHYLYGAALSLRGSTWSSRLRALTCLKCGFTQHYADKKGLQNMRDIKREYNIPEMENEYCSSCGAIFKGRERKCSICGHVDVFEKDMKDFGIVRYSCRECGIIFNKAPANCPVCGRKIIEI